MKRNTVTTVFFVALAGILSTIFIFQMFFSSQLGNQLTRNLPNFNTPTLGAIVSQTGFTNAEIQNYINTFVFITTFFKSLPVPSMFPTLIPIPSLEVNSTYLGTQISQTDGFDNNPTIMKDGSTYKMWWCGLSPQNSSTIFTIYYANSSDSTTWSARRIALSPTANSNDSLAVCQPSVIKVNGTYYMYYMGIGMNITNTTLDIHGGIFLATSTDGIQWSKYPSSKPTSVLTPGNDTFASINQPSALYHNNKFYLYFGNLSSGNGTDIFLATSDDGKHFSIQNNLRPVFSPDVGDDRDVKFLSSFGTFFMAYGSIDTNKIFWTNSTDGINWLPHDSTRTIKTGKYCNFAPAILGNPDGSMDRNSAVYYTSGDTLDNSTIFGCFNPSTWGIDASSISINISNPVQSFNSTNFTCSNTQIGYNCKLSYVNTLNESAIVVFFFTDTDGNIVNNDAPIASQGTYQISSIYSCKNSGSIRVSWKSYRKSDMALTNPISWSKTTERQTVSCGA